SGITVEYPPRELRQSLTSVETASKNQYTSPVVTTAASAADISNIRNPPSGPITLNSGEAGTVPQRLRLF
ncbi:unnamed protein product, partial [marine sediment metagenome]